MQEASLGILDQRLEFVGHYAGDPPLAAAWGYSRTYAPRFVRYCSSSGLLTRRK